MAEENTENGGSGEEQPIIVKKIVKADGHHGGAWKIAMADFATAMMAFFLLMWLLNSVSEDTKKAIAHYFDPTSAKVSENTSGAGGVLGGLSISPHGAMATSVSPIVAPQTKGSAVNNSSAKKAPSGEDAHSAQQEELTAGPGGIGGSDGTEDGADKAVISAEDILREEEQILFEDTKEAIEEAMKAVPDLDKLRDSLKIDTTDEGLKIEISAKDGRPMFDAGTDTVTNSFIKILEQVSDKISLMDNMASITGHTADTPFARRGGNYTNWELSADRANATRRALGDLGITGDRFYGVSGKAGTDLVNESKPKADANKRIAIIILREEITHPERFKKKAEELAGQGGSPALFNNSDTEVQSGGSGPSSRSRRFLLQQEEDRFRRTPGAVEFP